jgi:hypothetical protein
LRTTLAACFLSCVLGAPGAFADAAGTAKIHQPDGTERVYSNVRIRVQDHERLLITSHDGKGTLIVNKASCTAIASLMRCLASSAELDQNGGVLPIAVKSGTVWLNPGDTAQQLPYTSAQLPPRGVMMALETQRGTFVGLTGTVDEVIK